MVNAQQIIIDEFAEQQPVEEEVSVEDVPADAYIWKEPKKNKTIAQEYICLKCGRKRTIRFTQVPTPASCGKCPRCKEGRMYSKFIADYMIKAYKDTPLTKEEKDKILDVAIKALVSAKYGLPK